MKKTKSIQKKIEIRNTALKLFMSRGYNKTSIQNILDVLSLSKGGFYHHYKSKEELIDAIATDRAAHYLARLSGLNERNDLSGMEKFIEIFHINNAFQAENIEQILKSWTSLYSDDNKLFRLKLLERQIEEVVPQMAPFIRQAVDEEDFHTEYPEECVRLIIRYSDKTMEKVLPYLKKAWEDRNIIPRIYQQYAFLFHMMERILGAPEGSMRLFPQGFFERIFIPKEE
jgi:AcrR family transcriptional regulator